MYRKFVQDEVLDNGIIKGHMESIRTNADRIRSMTDEELANFITSIDGDYPCPPDNSCSCRSSNCMKGWLEWLKKEVKDELT